MNILNEFDVLHLHKGPEKDMDSKDQMVEFENSANCQTWLKTFLRGKNLGLKELECNITEF